MVLLVWHLLQIRASGVTWVNSPIFYHLPLNVTSWWIVLSVQFGSTFSQDDLHSWIVPPRVTSSSTEWDHRIIASHDEINLWMPWQSPTMSCRPYWCTSWGTLVRPSFVAGCWGCIWFSWHSTWFCPPCQPSARGLSVISTSYPCSTPKVCYPPPSNQFDCYLDPVVQRGRIWDQLYHTRESRRISVAKLTVYTPTWLMTRGTKLATNLHQFDQCMGNL